MKRLILIVALALAACATPVDEPDAQPTPQIVYVTPAPTKAPTPDPTAEPTPEGPQPFTMDEMDDALASEDCDYVMANITDDDRLAATSDLAVLEAGVNVLAHCTETGEWQEPSTTVAKGDTATVGDGWDIKVGKVDFDAWSTIKAENQFNDKPPKGTRAVMIAIAATWKGDGRTELDPAAHFQVIGEGTNAQIEMFGTDTTCGVIPKDLMMTDPTVRNGGKASGNICFVVPTEDIKTLELLWSDDAYGFDGVFTTFALR